VEQIAAAIDGRRSLCGFLIGEQHAGGELADQCQDGAHARRLVRQLREELNGQHAILAIHVRHMATLPFLKFFYQKSLCDRSAQR
jgi:hypothetical protein